MLLRMRDDSLTIETSSGSRADAVVLRLRGPLTLSTLFSLQDALQAQTARLTILDLSQVPYIDSAGLGTVLMFYVSAEKNGRRLALAGVSERVLSLIRMTRVDTVLSMFPSVEAAEQSAS
jgi:anti-anti-sigma factor